jgi:hypothetical protein
MHTSQNITPPSSKFDKMVSEQDIEKAINALDAQLIPNYSQVARDFGIERITLMRRHKGIYASRQEVTSLYHKLLTNTQEEALISQINKLIRSAATAPVLAGSGLTIYPEEHQNHALIFTCK